jgi:hypothetical protein
MVRMPGATLGQSHTAGKILAEAARRARDGRPMLSRRLDDRFPLNAIIPLGIDSPQNGRFRGTIASWGVDISRNGLGLLSEKPLAVGSFVYADFTNFGLPQCVLPIRILECSTLFGNTHRVSAVFVS